MPSEHDGRLWRQGEQNYDRRAAELREVGDFTSYGATAGRVNGPESIEDVEDFSGASDDR